VTDDRTEMKARGLKTAELNMQKSRKADAPVQVKICGLRRPEDIEIVNQTLPEYCGFIVEYDKSFRSVSREEVKNLVQNLDKRVCPVGVFVDPDPGLPAAMAREGIISMIQLHGNESPEMIRRLQAAARVPVVKAFIIRDYEDLQRAVNSPSDEILLDGGKGEGKPFAWEQIRRYRQEHGSIRPFFLAGGLTEENLREAIESTGPKAVDLSSSVEINRFKDRQKVENIIRLARGS